MNSFMITPWNELFCKYFAIIELISNTDQVKQTNVNKWISISQNPKKKKIGL